MNPRYALQPDQPLSVLLVEDDPGDVMIAREALAAGRLSTDLHVVTDGVDKLQPGAKVSVRTRGNSSTTQAGATSHPSTRPSKPGQSAGSGSDPSAAPDPSRNPRRRGAP